MGIPIWTLEGRSNVILDVISDHFGLTHPQMQAEILGAHRHTVDQLAAKGVDYLKLRNALTPQRDKHELALIFDSRSTGNDSWYGLPVYERVLDTLPVKNFTCALLSGDLLIDDQDLGFELLARGVRCHREVREFGYTGELFAIYVNNLSPTRAEALRHKLEPWPAYVGYVDCSFSSPTKDWLSTTLGTRYVKHDRIFIGPHEDDADEDANLNLPGWPLEAAGFEIVSIPEMYFGLFLHYKIERRVLSGETDTRHSLNAISTTPENLAGYRVEIADDRKHHYLSTHGGGLAIAGLENVSRVELERAIRDRLSSSYLYALESVVHPAGITNKFNLMLEFDGTTGGPVRLLASLEYDPDARRLRVITLF